MQRRNSKDRRRDSKERRRDSKKRQQRGGNASATSQGVDNHMKEILGEYKLAVPQPSQSENAFGSRYDVGKLALTGGARKDYKNRQRGGADATEADILSFIDNNNGTLVINDTGKNYIDGASYLELENIRNKTGLNPTDQLNAFISSNEFKLAYIKAKLPLVPQLIKTKLSTKLNEKSPDGISAGIAIDKLDDETEIISAIQRKITEASTTSEADKNQAVNEKNQAENERKYINDKYNVLLTSLESIYNTTANIQVAGRRKSQSKQSPKQQRNGKSPKKQSPKKNTKSPKKQQRGGNYYLNVDAQKIGGLAEVTRVDQPLAPEASTFNKYPEPLYLKDLSNPTTVNGMANSVNVANAPTTGQTAGAKKEYMFVTNKRTGQPMKVRKSPKQMQMNNKNMQVRVLKQQGGVEGEQSVYTGDMMQRDFSGKQPEWSPKVI